MASGYWNTISGRSVASAMRLKCASAIAGVLPERERRRRKHQQRRCAALRRHLGEPRRLDAAVGPDAVDDRQPGADLVLRDVEHALLLVEGAGGDFGRMRVDGDGREALDRGDVAQMLAEAWPRRSTDRSRTAAAPPGSRRGGHRSRDVAWAFSLFSGADRRGVASIAEFARQAVGGGAHDARAFLQGLDRQPPDRAGNADGADRSRR